MPNHVESCFGLIVSLCNSAEAAACGRHESSLALRFDMVAAVFGVSSGSFIGCRFGTPAKIIGGLVLIGIGIRLLL